MNPSHPDLTRMSERDLLILALDALSALNNTVSTLSEQQHQQYEFALDQRKLTKTQEDHIASTFTLPADAPARDVNSGAESAPTTGDKKQTVLVNHCIDFLQRFCSLPNKASVKSLLTFLKVVAWSHGVRDLCVNTLRASNYRYIGDDAIANYYKTFEPVVERYTRCYWDDAQITGSVEPSSASCGSSTSIVQKVKACESTRMEALERLCPELLRGWAIRMWQQLHPRRLPCQHKGNQHADNAGDTDDDGIDIFEDEDEEYDPFLAPLRQQQQQQQQRQPQQPQVQ
ncbi:hypothetical protein BJV82DRAFT_662592 [Fennellomyces sp. T-0311]|nr:hypothetical protein BJV82DRAFT_662592 [Fennellomyces sp. T-0311]